MGDFPSHWKHVRALIEGGQGHTYVVTRADENEATHYAFKRLKNKGRAGYYEREVEACRTLDHPNVLKLIEHGHTPKGQPYLVTEFCSGGSLEELPQAFSTPITGLKFFQQIVAGVAHAHSHSSPIYHLDIKPANILIKDGQAVVGDFGICFIDDNRQSLTNVGPRGPIRYCAPELREEVIEDDVRLAAADIYSLGKVLYWLFTKKVYDGHEEAYSDDFSRHLSKLFLSHSQFAFVDELIALTIQRKPASRFKSVADLAARLQQVVDRIEAGGRVLDLRIPQRCLYCGEGHYRPAHDFLFRPHDRQMGMPTINDRKNPRESATANPEQRQYGGLNTIHQRVGGGTPTTLDGFLCV